MALKGDVVNNFQQAIDEREAYIKDLQWRCKSYSDMLRERDARIVVLERQVAAARRWLPSSAFEEEDK